MTVTERFCGLKFRGPSFDLIRLVAATIVLVHHSRAIGYTDIRLDPLFSLSGGYIHFGFLAVAAFFAISGFLVTPSLLRSGNVLEFAIKRALRIFPALVVVVAVTMLLLGPCVTTFALGDYFASPFFFRYAKNVTTSLSSYLPGIIDKSGQPLVVNTALWTLQFEVLCYAILAVSSILGFLRKRRFFFILFVVVYTIDLLQWYAPHTLSLLPERVSTLNTLFVYFCAGAAIFLYGDLIPFSFGAVTFLLAITGAALAFGLGPFAMPICVPYVCVYCGLTSIPGSTLLKSDCSYGTYLIHSPVLIVFLTVIPLESWWLVALIVFIITIVLAYLSWTFIEKPALRRKKALTTWLNATLIRLDGLIQNAIPSRKWKQ